MNSITKLLTIALLTTPSEAVYNQSRLKAYLSHKLGLEAFVKEDDDLAETCSSNIDRINAMQKESQRYWKKQANNTPATDEQAEEETEEEAEEEADDVEAEADSDSDVEEPDTEPEDESDVEEKENDDEPAKLTPAEVKAKKAWEK